MNPTAGFNGGLVTEVETLCFYDSSIWTPSLLPPPACRNAPITLSPWTLTFVGQSVGSASVPQTATLANTGTVSVGVIGIVPSGDFTQTNNCHARSVSFLDDLLKSSPQTLSLAGLGLSAQ